MPDVLQVVGLLIREGAPVMVNLFQNQNKIDELDRAQQLRKEGFEKMRGALARQGFDQMTRPGAEPTCPACSVVSVRNAVGHRTWVHLHSLPGTMGSHPSPELQDRMAQYITSMVANFPCEVCAAKGMNYIREHPVDASSPEALAMWLCRFHDQVNQDIGKPLFGCSIGKLQIA